MLRKLLKLVTDAAVNKSKITRVRVCVQTERTVKQAIKQLRASTLGERAAASDAAAANRYCLLTSLFRSPDMVPVVLDIVFSS